MQVFYPDSAEGDGKRRLDDDEDEEVEMLYGEYQSESFRLAAKEMRVFIVRQ